MEGRLRRIEDTVNGLARSVGRLEQALLGGRARSRSRSRSRSPPNGAGRRLRPRTTNGRVSPEVPPAPPPVEAGEIMHDRTISRNQAKSMTASELEPWTIWVSMAPDCPPPKMCSDMSREEAHQYYEDLSKAFGGWTKVSRLWGWKEMANSRWARVAFQTFKFRQECLDRSWEYFEKYQYVLVGENPEKAK